jgi:hypothetical protein
MREAYAAEFVEFAAAAREDGTPAVTGADARRALTVALAYRIGTAAGAHRCSGIGGGGVMTSPFTLAVCAEMVFTKSPLLERVRRIDALGFAVEIWDWTTKDIDALAATGATFSSMTGYIHGNLTDPEGAEQLLATAQQSIPVAARLNISKLNLHGTGLGEGGLPVKPVEVVTGEMWFAAEKALSRIARLGEQRESCSAWRTSTPPSITLVPHSARLPTPSPWRRR